MRLIANDTIISLIETQIIALITNGDSHNSPTVLEPWVYVRIHKTRLKVLRRRFPIRNSVGVGSF